MELLYSTCFHYHKVLDCHCTTYCSKKRLPNSQIHFIVKPVLFIFAYRCGHLSACAASAGYVFASPPKHVNWLCIPNIQNCTSLIAVTGLNSFLFVSLSCGRDSVKSFSSVSEPGSRRCRSRGVNLWHRKQSGFISAVGHIKFDCVISVRPADFHSSGGKGEGRQ